MVPALDRCLPGHNHSPRRGQHSGKRGSSLWWSLPSALSCIVLALTVPAVCWPRTCGVGGPGTALWRSIVLGRGEAVSRTPSEVGVSPLNSPRPGSFSDLWRLPGLAAFPRAPTVSQSISVSPFVLRAVLGPGRKNHRPAPPPPVLLPGQSED